MRFTVTFAVLALCLTVLLGDADVGWIPETASDLDGLSDVTISGPTSDQVLTYDGTEWVNSDSSGGAGSGVRVVEITDSAAPKTVYSTGPQAVYDPATNRTYVGFLGEDRDLYFTYYDHEAGTAATPVLADTRQIAANDIHAAPSVTVDTEGHIHAFWSAHNTQHRHVKSDSPHDISAWSAQSITTAGTYARMVVDRDTGNLYVFDRSGSGHGSSFPAHEYLGMRKSTNGGTSWSAVTQVIDTTGTPEAASDVYMGEVKEAADGRFHLAWTVARGSAHDGDHKNVYHAIFDPSDDTWSTAGGTDLGSVIDWTEHADCLVSTEDDVNYRMGLTVNDDRVLLSWGYRAASDQTAKAAIWDGSTWTVENTGVTQDKDGAAFTALYPVKDGIRLLIGEAVTGEDDLTWYGAPPDGAFWVQLDTLIEGSTGEGFDRVTHVPGGGESVAVTQEAPASYAHTNATASDLVPLYLILDAAHVSDHSHDDTYYTESEIDAITAALTGELLMQDGVTAPPVPVETEDRDDWLYEG